MSYSQNVTMIDDLPDLNDIANNQNFHNREQYGNNHINDPMTNAGARNFSGHKNSYRNLQAYTEEPNVGKFIRNHHKPPNESGMFGNQNMGNYPTNYTNENFVMNEDINPYPFANSQDLVKYENYAPQRSNHPMGNCLDVSEHVENCPICRKIYKNDKTILIIIIVILVVLCILLLKKVLNL